MAIKAYTGSTTIEISAVDANMLNTKNLMGFSRKMDDYIPYNRQYRAIPVDYPRYHWVVGQLRCNPLSNEPFIRVLNNDGNTGSWEDIPVKAETICARSGYNIKSGVNSEETNDIYEKDLLFVYDKSTNLAGIYYSYQSYSDVWCCKEFMANNPLHNSILTIKSLMSGNYFVAKIGNMLDGINVKSFISMDFPYFNVGIKNDVGLVSLLRARFCFLHCKIVNNKFNMTDVVDEYFKSGGYVSEDLRLKILEFSKELFGEDEPLYQIHE